MLTIVLDKFLPTEVTIIVDGYREEYFSNIITGQRDVPYSEIHTIPDIQQQDFTTIQIFKDGVELPLLKTYDTILNFMISTSALTDIYCSYSITIGKKGYES